MKFIAKLLFKIFGWKVIGALPTGIYKYIAIVAPHTSNWDFPVGIVAKFYIGYPGNYLGKHTLFRFPYGWLFRALGGHPVNRAKSTKMVDQVADLFKNHKNFVLVLSPEGTRKKVEKWKTGFYYMALKAEVPIVKIAFDYGKKAVIIEPPFYPSGDREKDLRHIYDYYRNVQPLHPEKYFVPTI